MYPVRCRSTQADGCFNAKRSHELKKPNIPVNPFEPGGLVPIELFAHDATELCDISGVDADILLCQCQHSPDPRFGHAAQPGSDGKVIMVPVLRSSPRVHGGDHPELGLETHPLTPLLQCF